ncbi:MAG: hypothetical protein J0H41_19010 [Rhizobiales bacterium]|nr:hypothetical protein [Hyphomicrobiales bacterium]
MQIVDPREASCLYRAINACVTLKISCASGLTERRKRNRAQNALGSLPRLIQIRNRDFGDGPSEFRIPVVVVGVSHQSAEMIDAPVARIKRGNLGASCPSDIALRALARHPGGLLPQRSVMPPDNRKHEHFRLFILI